VLAAAAYLCVPAVAEVRLPHVFGDHMVLQRGKPIRLWGWAAGGEKVTVAFAGQSKTTVAGGDGRWTLQLEPLDANRPPAQLLVTGAANTVALKDVAIGEVWLVSGQSNMEMRLLAAKDGEIEVPAARYPGIRVLSIPLYSRTKPQEDFPVEVSGLFSEDKGRWLVCDPNTAGSFPAAGYYFARQIHRVLGVPVGRIDNSWGGTTVEAWISRPTLEKIPEAAPLLKFWHDRLAAWSPQEAARQYEAKLAAWQKQAAEAKAAGKGPPGKPAMAQDPAADRNHPGGCFNACIAPIGRFALRGAVFYQGVNNAIPGRANLYGRTFPAIVPDWRRAFGEPELPFCIVQLCTWGAHASEMFLEEAMLSPAAHIRETQLKTHLAAANSGLVVTTDLGHRSIHPPNKKDVGLRIARWALATQYGMAHVAWTGPLYQSMTKQGGKVILHFRPVGPTWSRRTGAAPENVLKGFVIAGADRKWHGAQARCVGETVEVWSDAVADPAAVRYAWATFPEGNLVGGRDLPASPFRTDDWPLLEDAPLDHRSKEYQAWRQRRHQRVLQARQDARLRMSQETQRTLRTLGAEKEGS
jgi:sialate O-acetylesterase